MVNWAQMHDCYGDFDRVPELPELLARVEREDDDAEAWDELRYRLILECDLVFPASSAALPRLVRLASRSAPARGLAGAIVRCAAGRHDCDDLPAGCAEAIAELRELLDRHLRSRPDDYLATFRDLIAVEGHYHWGAVLGDFSDDFYQVACPHCAVEVTIAIGGYGCYSAIRDWNLGDVDRHDLRPASPRGSPASVVGSTRPPSVMGKLCSPTESPIFGQAECPRCASVFNIADEYTSSNRPLM
ncbi:hypothetical protein ABWJ92_37785 [Streptomyces sp. NPDC000609]|uniref:hypothetical protein n=1 Tax=Streptomyces sp. NPDC000609 TaxID=3160957 RepID=UPI0033970572